MQKRCNKFSDYQQKQNYVYQQNVITTIYQQMCIGTIQTKNEGRVSVMCCVEMSLRLLACTDPR